MFFFDITCPYAYTAFVVVQRTNLPVEMRPVLLGAVYEATKAPQGKQGSASDAMVPAKQRLMKRDLLRTLERHAVQISWPAKHPQRSVNALRALCNIADKSLAWTVARALFDAYWQQGLVIEDDEVVANIFRKCGITADFRDSGALRKNTDLFLQKGGFGVPAFVVGNELFWGVDRLHFVEAAILKVDRVPQHRLKPKWDGKQRTLTFYFDFSSPWAYLGYTQVERVAKECGARIEYVPILLGALFKKIEGPNMPMLTYSDAKRNYLSRDMQRWADYWGTKAPVFPAVFPIRTVTALRVALIEPATVPTIWAACWQNNENVSEDAVLKQVLAKAGFDAEKLIAQSKDAKDKLTENTERAFQVGLCGVPSYQVDGGEVIWGQDRYNVVADLLCGHTDGQASKL